jgi:hypothetical protein
MTENRGPIFNSFFLIFVKNKSKMKLTLVIKKGKSVFWLVI